MSDLLKVAFQHNAWATKELLTFCRRLTVAQLSTATQGECHSGLPGHHQPVSLLDTLDHLQLADADYLPRPRMERPVWALEQRHASDLDELRARADETAQLWQVYLDDPLEATDLLLLDDGTYEVQSSIPIVQALHHGTLHRGQVCAILTGLGIEPPDLQVWTFGEATGRGRELNPRVVEP
jgi:uncharacterized damage-inducible protein DinB